MWGLKKDESARKYFKQLRMLTIFGLYYVLSTIMCFRLQNLSISSDVKTVSHPYNIQNESEFCINFMSFLRLYRKNYPWL